MDQNINNQQIKGITKGAIDKSVLSWYRQHGNGCRYSFWKLRQMVKQHFLGEHSKDHCINLVARQLKMHGLYD